MRSGRITRLMAVAAIVAGVGVADARAPQSSTAKAPAAAPSLDIAWSVELTTRDVSGLSASNSTVIVTTAESTLAFSAEDGRSLWTKAPGSEVAPALVGEDFAILSATGVHVLARDGALQWQADLAGVTHAVAAGSDLILAAGRTLARWSNGKESWHLSLDSDPATPPVLYGTTVFIGVKPAAVVGIDAIKGQVVSQLALPKPPDALGLAPERLMVCTSEGNSSGTLSSYRTTLKLDLDWPFPLIRCIGTPVSDDKRTYAAFVDNTVKAFDTGSGHQRWTGRLPSRPQSGPIRFPNSIVVPLSTGGLSEFTLDGTPVGGTARPASLPKLIRMLSAVTSPDRTRVFTTGAPTELTGGRLLFAWSRAVPKKSGGPGME